MDAGLLVARVVLGVLMAAHGSQKLFGWFGGYGLNGTAGFFEALGFRPGRLFAATASAAEIAGGLLLAAGFLSPFASGLIVSGPVSLAALCRFPCLVEVETSDWITARLVPRDPSGFPQDRETRQVGRMAHREAARRIAHRK